MTTFWSILIAIIIFLVIAVLISVLILSIKYIIYFDSVKYWDTESIFITSIDGERLINSEEIEHIVKIYNTIDKQYEIRYSLKSNCQIIEKFETKLECEHRFKEIKEELTTLY